VTAATLERPGLEVQPALLEARGITVQVSGKTLLEDISVVVRAGDILGIVGENGAGKSTLLRVLSGELQPTQGTVMLEGKAVRSFSALELARRRAVLAQDARVAFEFSALEVVALGRHPHADGNPDQIALEALAICDSAALAARGYASLSGGERARVQLARALAQVWDAPGALLLLDEPTASLDLAHQQLALRLARRWAARGAAVAVILHDLNLARAHSDRVLMLHQGRAAAYGAPEDVLTPARILECFHVPVSIVPHPQTGVGIIVPD
jgi:iron complex transport system ATP-binding protein